MNIPKKSIHAKKPQSASKNASDLCLDNKILISKSPCRFEVDNMLSSVQFCFSMFESINDSTTKAAVEYYYKKTYELLSKTGMSSFEVNKVAIECTKIFCLYYKS